MAESYEQACPVGVSWTPERARPTSRSVIGCGTSGTPPIVADRGALSERSAWPSRGTQTWASATALLPGGIEPVAVPSR